MKKIELTPYTRTDTSSGDSKVMSACPENMELLMKKINELVETVNKLEYKLMIDSKLKSY